MKEGKVAPIKWVVGFTRQTLPRCLGVTSLEMLSAVMSIHLALLFRDLIDGLVHNSLDEFWYALTIYGGAVFFQILLRCVIRHQEECVRVKIENIVKGRVISTLLSASYTDLSQIHTGEIQNRVVSDSAVIAEGIASVFQTAASLTVRFGGAMLLLIFLDRRFCMVFFSGIFVFFLLRKLVGRRMKEAHREVQEADGCFRMYLQEIFSNILTVRAFSLEVQAAKHTVFLLNKYGDRRITRNKAANLCTTGTSMAIQAGRLLGIAWYGSRILEGQTSIGTMLAVLQLLNQVQQPLSTASNCIVKYHKMVASAERLMEFERLPVETFIESRETNDAHGGICKVDFEKIRFTYPGTDVCVLSNLSFSICAGQLLALTGHSGAGKSTVLKLLLALYRPDAGQITVTFQDGMREPLGEKHRKIFAYVPQGNHLLSGTVEGAITLQEPSEIDKERLDWACEMSCVDFLNILPLGLLTPLGEAGAGFSEGQIQRLAIARALYSQAQVLLLDEATSALDADTQTKLLDNLRSIPDRTVVIVTHSSTVMNRCDAIMELG